MANGSIEMHRACPFCGGRPTAYVTKTCGPHAGGRVPQVTFAKAECTDCGASFSYFGDDDEDAVRRVWELWDGREGGSDDLVEPYAEDDGIPEDEQDEEGMSSGDFEDDPYGRDEWKIDELYERRAGYDSY